MTRIDYLEQEVSDLEFFMRIPTVNSDKKRELEEDCAYKQKEIQDRMQRDKIRTYYS